jgi:hypothetical protein
MNTRFLIFLLLFPFALVAQQYSALHIPDTLLKNASEVIRMEEYHFKAKSEEQGVMKYKKVITLLNKKCTSDQWAEYYDSASKIKKMTARIFDASGQLIRSVHKDEIEDYSAVSDFSIYEDDRVKVLELKHSEYPYTVELEYEQVVSGVSFAVFPDWQVQGYNQSVEHASFTIEMPQGIDLHYKMLNSNLEPSVQASDGYKTYRWEVNHLKAIPAESYSPSSFHILPYLMTAPSQFKINQYTGGMSNWEGYSSFVHKLYVGRNELPKPIVAEVQAIAAKGTTEREKIELLYQYMQQNMRYVSVQLGIGGWQPFSASYVSENKYGDCKALTNFMHSILSEVGITSHPALIRSGQLYYEVEPEFTTPFFNHVILYVPSEDMWLECTSNYYPAGYIGKSNSGRNTLLVKPGGGHLKATPALDADFNLSQSHHQLVLAEDGSVEAKGTVFMQGGEHEAFRFFKHYYAQKELEEKWLEDYSMPGLGLTSLDLTPSEETPTVNLTYTGKVRRYASKAGKRLFVPLNVANPWKDIPKKKTSRQHPIMWKQNNTHIDTITIQLPEGYQIESIKAETYELASPFGTYTATISKQGNESVTFIRKLILQACERPAADYDVFRSFFKEASKIDQSMVVLVEKKT